MNAPLQGGERKDLPWWQEPVQWPPTGEPFLESGQGAFLFELREVSIRNEPRLLPDKVNECQAATGLARPSCQRLTPIPADTENEGKSCINGPADRIIRLDRCE